MTWIKRIFRLVAVNAAIMITIYTILYILQAYFGVSLGNDIISWTMIGGVFGFGGAIVSLLMSKTLAKSAYSIQIVSAEDVNTYDRKIQLIYNTVADVSRKEGFSMPEVGFYNSPEANAFATGANRNNSLVAVSTGLLEQMNDNEIIGVIGHEMSHIINGDMITMTLVQGVLNTFVFVLARVIGSFVASRNDDDNGGYGYSFVLVYILEIVFGILASIVANTYSRYREYHADAGSAHLYGKNNMIASLLKLKTISEHNPIAHDNYATMKIFGSNGSFMGLFSTHPTLDSRIDALQKLSSI